MLGADIIKQLIDIANICDDKRTFDLLWSAVNRQRKLISESKFPPVYPWTYDTNFQSHVKEAAAKMVKERQGNKIYANKIVVVKRMIDISNRTVSIVEAKNFVEKYFAEWY